MTTVTKDEEFYVDDKTIIIRVEDKLFKLPQHVLTKHSPVLRSVFTSQEHPDDAEWDGTEPSEGELGDGSSDERAFVLEGVKASEFVSLLRLIYPTSKNGKLFDFSLDEWKSILKIAASYEMAEVKAFAVERIKPLLGDSPSLQVQMARVHNVKEWLLPAFHELVKRKDPLDEEDVKLIGLTDALKVMSLREDRIHVEHSKSGSISIVKNRFEFSIDDWEFRRRLNL